MFVPVATFSSSQVGAEIDMMLKVFYKFGLHPGRACSDCTVEMDDLHLTAQWPDLISMFRVFAYIKIIGYLSSNTYPCFNTTMMEK